MVVAIGGKHGDNAAAGKTIINYQGHPVKMQLSTSREITGCAFWITLGLFTLAPLVYLWGTS